MVEHILVTGANGQVGCAIQKIAENTEHNFFFATKENLDITKAENLSIYLDRHTITGIINAAAYTAVDQAEKEPDKCFAVNVSAVKNIALAARERDIWVIHFSSDYVYNPTHNHFSQESDSTNPVGIYANSKLNGEEVVLGLNPKTIVIRTSWVFYEQGNNFVNTMLRLTKEKDVLRVVNDQIGSPTYAKDIANLCLLLISSLKNKTSWGVYNFSNSGIISWFEFASAINELADHCCNIIAIPSSEYPTPAPRPMNSRMSKEKIKNHLDIEIRNWRDSLIECLNNLK